MRIAITGISGYLGQQVLKLLDKEDSIESIRAIDLKSSTYKSSKLEMHIKDVRDRDIAGIIRGSDVMIHLAFIVDEIRDKKKTYDISFNGSRNVIDSCIAAGVPWLVHFSSVSAYGGYPDNPPLITEDHFPRGNSNSYYSYTKAEVEHYLNWVADRHPELEITLIRPCVVAGPNIDNILAQLMKKKVLALPVGCDPEFNLVHEEDLAEAVMVVLRQRATGAYNVCADDTMRMSQLAKMAGSRLVFLPEKLAYLLADILFYFGAFPVSSHWLPLLSYPLVASNEKLKALGWRSRYSTREIAEITLRAKGITVHPI